MLNTSIILGRLTADPELKTTNNGTSCTRFTVAVDRPTRQGEEKHTDFINCVSWRQTAEFVSRYFSKGQPIAVEGSIQTGQYTNQKGQKVYTTFVKVDRVSFAGNKGDRDSGQQSTSYQSGSRTQASSPPRDDRRSAQQGYQQGSIDDYMYGPLDGDLPF